jgi:hypothetical protein
MASLKYFNIVEFEIYFHDFDCNQLEPSPLIGVIYKQHFPLLPSA